MKSLSRSFVLLVVALLVPFSIACAQTERAVFVMTIDGSINPATDDFVKTTLDRATRENAKLVVIRLNTPGGLLTSMQSIVQQILESKIPIAVYVSPSGSGAMSAGVFITLAGHVAAMAPGTTIGAAHPVSGGGQDIDGDMREKVENFAVSLVKAIAEQRGRDTKWAELAVRESVAITDREALEKKVIDLGAEDLDQLLTKIEGRTVTLRGVPSTLVKLAAAPRVNVEMSFKQIVVNFLSDPNIAILLGLGAVLGIGIELYHPGAMLPGIVGVLCLVLSLVAAQVLPINYGGLILFGLGVIFFLVELAMPTFGIWGAAGIVSLVLGSIYLIDSDMVWGSGVIEVNRMFVGSIAFVVGALLVLLAGVVVRSARNRVTSGPEGLIGSLATVKESFTQTDSFVRGRVSVAGELWVADLLGEAVRLPRVGDLVRVTGVQEGLILNVERA